MSTKLTLIDSQIAGISGDMLLGAMIDAGANPEAVHSILELIPKHFSRCKSLRLQTAEVRKHGFRTCSVDFEIIEADGEIRAQELSRSADAIAKASNLTDKAKVFARSTIELLTDVESNLHGLEISQTHLHEAGSTDTLADVFGVAAACDTLGVFDGEILGTPVAVGSGSASFSHGTLATPVPAVLEIARRKKIPIVGGPEAGELATPTGVAMLANLAKGYLEAYPPIIPDKVGYGAGKKDLVKAPNVMRVVIGQSINPEREPETVEVLETNVDDVSGEILGHSLQQILDSGAKDAWITPALFKKGRPGHVLHAICDPRDAKKIAEVMFRETGTLGVRFHHWGRSTLQREISTVRVEVAGRTLEVKVKLAKDISGKIVTAKPEFEDIRAAAEALGRPARDVSRIVMREFARKSEGTD